MKIPITILLLASLFAASCGEPPMPPSDEEMIRHFATHERAFRKGVRAYLRGHGGQLPLSAIQTRHRRFGQPANIRGNPRHALRAFRVARGGFIVPARTVAVRPDAT